MELATIPTEKLTEALKRIEEESRSDIAFFAYKPLVWVNPGLDDNYYLSQPAGRAIFSKERIQEELRQRANERNHRG